MRMRYLVALTILVALPVMAQEQSAAAGAVLEERDRLIRERYEEVLAKDPLQDAAFDRVYESYMLTEGVDAWLEKLTPAEGAAETAGGLVLRGRILARQFKAGEAVETLSKARALGEASPAFNALLGRLYYETGKDADAIALLGAALDSTESPEQRSAICRMLGSVYLRSGQRAEAAAVWERIAELNPNDLFALQELAEIYEENRLWDEAIAAQQRIVTAASNDPYRQCHAWRAIGQSLLAKDDHAGAIAAYEQGLALAAPGNWLFEDLKNRLVGVYESRGDLEGLSAYLEARIAQDATDLSLSELLADVTMRRGDLEKAEALLKDIVARSPGRESALEMLIGLYRQAGRPEDLAATFEVLIAQYPNEPDYLRRLGEAWLEQKLPKKAQETWRRVVGDGAKASNHALLAEWLERSEFFPEAAAAYEAALAIQPDREWRLRVAGLKYDMGEEEAALAAWQAAVAAEDTPAGEVAEIAAILVSKEFKAEAEALYARAMALEPENLDHVLAYARLLSGREDHAGAVAQYTRLAEQDTSEYLKNEGERGLLDAYEALGTLDAQRAAWEEAIAQAPDDTVARLKLARLYARMGMRPSVVKLYEECAAIDPERIEFQRLLATAYKENRQTDKAVAVLEGLMDKDAGRAQAYLRELLALYGTAGRGQEAIRSAEKLVELSPASPEARTALAQAYLRNGEPDKGLQQYRDLVQLDGTQSAYYREFGDALQGLGHFGEAQEIYRKMLDAATDDTTRLDAVNRLAAVYVRNGQRDAILAEFQRRVSAAPKSLSAYQELAAVHRASGDMQGALETLERAKGEVEDRDAVLRLLMAEAFQAGDNVKVVAVYEELLSRSAQPTPHDLDRLAGAYAQVGRMDEALALWDRIAKENSDDATVQLMVARQLEQFGYYDESNARTERALEIDPYDYALRFDYAQRLIGFNEVDQGLAQMKAILDIGERPEAPQGNAPAASSAMPQQQRTFPMNMGMSPRQYRGNFGGGSRWYGQSFADLRQQVVQSMVHLSRQYEAGEPLIDTYRKRIDEQPENIDARRDYLLVCEASEEHERALEAAKELLALQPEDDSLRWRIFGYLQQLGRADEAIAVAVELAASPNAQLAGQAQLMRIRLLAENSRFDEAEAVLAELTSEQPEMAQIYLQVASSFQNATDPAIADEYYQKAAELEPRFRHHATMGRARLRQERGDVEAARDLYIEAVFEAAVVDPNIVVTVNPRVNPMPLYMPQGGRRHRQPGGNVTQLPGFNHPMLDHERAEALNQAFRLATEPEAFEPVIARLRAEAAKYVTAEDDAQRQLASNFVFFLVTSLRATEREAEALGVLEELLAGRPGDPFLVNLRLFLLDEQGRLDEMRAIYTEMETSNPTTAGEVARARLQIALVQEDAAALPALYRALPDAPGVASGRNAIGVRASQLNQVVRALENAGARAEARALLEEELARSREYRILILLARSLGEAGEHDQAIAYAREASEKQSGVRTPGGNLHYSMDGMTLQTQGLQGLEVLWNAYRLAGRESELIAEFEERIEGQPTSVTLRQSLIGLYMESRQYDLARAQMEKLLELRPNDVQLKVRYAGLLESNNDPTGALAVLESVAAARPSTARSISGEIRRLYKDLGKKEELAALDEQLIREARSAEQLQSLARQLAEERDFAKAAELMQKALRSEPENNWLQTQVGDYLWQADQKNEAVDAYLKFLQPTTPRQVIYVDPGQMPQIIQRIEEAGRLEELKAIAAETTAEPMSARALKILGALIARHEKRPEDAEAILKSVAEGGGDQQVFALLADLAEARNDPAAAIQYLESVTPTGGIPDHRRIAMLHLKNGDTDKSIQSWKKFAEQNGGYYGYEEALRSFAEAGRGEAVGAFFRDVYSGIPASDPSRQQLANALIRINDESGDHDALIDEVVFTEDNKWVGDLVREYIGNYNGLPGLALRRLAPLVSRYPDEARVQGLYAEILGEAGRWDEAIAIYEALVAREGGEHSYKDAYLQALRHNGQLEKVRDVALAQLRAEKNPTDHVIAEACRAVAACDGAIALAALRDEIVAAADPDQQLRIRRVFILEDAARGEIAAARSAMRALLDEDPGSDSTVQYFRFLLRYGAPDEAAAFYKTTLRPLGEDTVAALDTEDTMRVLLASGNPRDAWEHLLLAQRRMKPRYEAGRAQRAFELFQEYDTPASVLDAALSDLRRPEPLVLNDRLFIAEAEIALGRLPLAMEMLREYTDNNVAAAILSSADYNLPGELKDPRVQVPDSPLDPGVLLAGNPHLAPPPSLEPARTQLHAAESMLSSGEKERAIALLDTVVFDETTRSLLSFRARLYSDAGAFDKAIADYDAYLAGQPEDDDATLRRAMARIGAGRLEEAMENWREMVPAKRRGIALNFARALGERKHYEQAQLVLDESPSTATASTEAALLRARILLETGDNAALTALMESHYSDSSEHAHDQIASNYGALLLPDARWKILIAEGVDPENVPLSHALLYIAQQLHADDQVAHRQLIADSLSAVQWSGRALAAQYSNLLKSIGRKDDALRLLLLAIDLPGSYALSDDNLLDELYNLEAYAESVREALRLMEKRPELLRRGSFMLHAAERAGDPVLAEEAFARLIAMDPSDNTRAYFTALHAWYGGDKADGAARLAALVDAPETSAQYLQEIASIYAQEQDNASLLKVRARIANMGSAYDKLELITLLEENGDLASALDVYSTLFSAERDVAGKAREALIACAETGAFEAAERLIVDRVKATPEHPVVPDLLAIRAKLASRTGATQGALDLVALGVPEDAIAIATLKSNIIDTWVVSKPENVYSWTEMSAPLDGPMAALLQGQSVPVGDPPTWRAVEARHILPDIPRYGAAWPAEWGLEGNLSSYCLAEIESADDRNVKLAHGSAGWSRIWVNEAEVYANFYNRINLAGTDLIEVPLRKGVNRLLVRVRSCGRGASFTISIVENGEGLVVRAPELPQTLAVSAAQ